MAGKRYPYPIQSNLILHKQRPCCYLLPHLPIRQTPKVVSNLDIQEPMKKYRCLMKGRNFLIAVDGKKRKYTFVQELMVDANHPKQAEQLAIARVTLDKELKKITLNNKKKPPVIQLETIWEVGAIEDISQIETGRTFYPQKKWWCFWKKAEPVDIVGGQPESEPMEL